MIDDLPLGEVIGLLDAAAIPHMVVGSFASNQYGEGRTTWDLDLVVEVDQQAVTRLLEGISRDRFYVPEEAARRAGEHGGQFNLLDLRSEWKIDLMVRRDRPFNVQEFARRLPVVIAGVHVYVATPEDTVLSKLEWSKDSGSARQVEDVVGIIEEMGDLLDHDHLDRWAPELGVVELLAQARAMAVPPS